VSSSRSRIPSRARRLRRAAALGGVAVLALPAAAGADSISFVRDGDVHLATPDGSRTVRLTTEGGYRSASQADDGRIVALRGSRLRLLDRRGAVLADFSPVAAGTAGSIQLSGPFDPVLSPDGSRVAYGFFVQYRTGDPHCGRPGGCQTGQLYAGTGYARSTGPAEWDEAGFRPEWGWGDPSWIDDRRTLLSGPSSAFVEQVAIDEAGDPATAAEWFSEGAVGNLYDGELNRQGTGAAFVANSQGDRLLVYRLPGAAPATAPQGCLDAPASGGAWSSPSWSPDGERLVWAGPQGLYVATLAGLAGGCPAGDAVAVRTMLPGATAPDWGPADVPADGGPGGTAHDGPTDGAPGPAPGSGPVGPGAGAPAGGATTATVRLRLTRRSWRVRRGGRVTIAFRAPAATRWELRLVRAGRTALRLRGSAGRGTRRIVVRPRVRPGRYRLVLRATAPTGPVAAGTLTVRR
jgi:hypothetical protein